MDLAFSTGNFLVGFLWDEYEQKKTGEEEKSEGEGKRRKEKKGKSCLPNLNLLDCVLYVVDFFLYPRAPGNNSFKDSIF